MNLATAYRAELLKTKRTSSFWLSLLGAGFIPAIFLMAYLLKPESAAKNMQAAPWNVHFYMGWKALSGFLLPMFVVLLCALLPQIEYRNNTWKQVYASPQTYGQIYFSKLLTIHTMLLFFFVAYNVFMLLTGVVAAMVHHQFTFLKSGFEWGKLLALNVKVYVSTLGIAAIQYFLSLRFKNFIVPVGIGLGLLIAATIAHAFGWEYIYEVPFAHPNLTLEWVNKPATYWLQPHEWNALVYCMVFTIVGFYDIRYRKEKG